MQIQQRISLLIKDLCDGIHEREQIMAVCLLGAIAGHNTFLFGPPGTAKSLISRRLANAFENPQYFEYLMNRFSTPEEVFGPVSIKALKEDKYTRKIEGYLPTANFAFLDEIWKASPAILNNLLTIINEHRFKNGDEVVDVPLKSLIAASNEVPAPNQGLEALYDRFIIRLLVPPIQQESHFKDLLNNKPSNYTPNIRYKISYHLLNEWRKHLHSVEISDDTFLIIQYIRKELTKQFKKLDIYVSDRRWQRAAILLKYCLWTTPENREAVEKIVMNAIKSCGFSTGISLSNLDKEKESLDKEINKELYHSHDVYDTVLLNKNEYFKVYCKFEHKDSYYRNHFIEKTFYIPFNFLNKKDAFHPLDENGNEITDIACDFNGQGSCQLYVHYTGYNHNKNRHPNYKEYTFTPPILFKKGAKKKDINKRLIQSLAQAVSEIREQCQNTLKEIELKNQEYQKVLASPFVEQTDIDVAVSGVLDQIEQLKLRIVDCERLEALCR